MDFVEYYFTGMIQFVEAQDKCEHSNYRQSNIPHRALRICFGRISAGILLISKCYKIWVGPCATCVRPLRRQTHVVMASVFLSQDELVAASRPLNGSNPAQSAETIGDAEQPPLFWALNNVCAHDYVRLPPHRVDHFGDFHFAAPAFI